MNEDWCVYFWLEQLTVNEDWCVHFWLEQLTVNEDWCVHIPYSNLSSSVVIVHTYSDCV